MSERFWIIDLDPNIYPGPAQFSVVDEQEGGVIAFTYSEELAQRLIDALEIVELLDQGVTMN